MLFYKRIFIVISLLFCLNAKAVEAVKLKVAVASNFHWVLTELSDDFQQKTGIELSLSSGASGILYGQIRQGAPFDVFLSADEKLPVLLVNQELALNSSLSTYALGRLVLWQPSRDVGSREHWHNSLESLSEQDRIAIANPRFAPYGQAAQTALEALANYDQIADKLVKAANVNQAFQFVDTGHAQLGFVPLSLLKRASVKFSQQASRYQSYWLLPQSAHQAIKQKAVVVKRSKNQAAGQALIDYLLSPEVQGKLAQMGYSPVKLAE